MSAANRMPLLLISASLLLLLGFSLGWRFAEHTRQPVEEHAVAHAENPADADKRKILYWYDPMMPQQHFDKPGKSPYMDMELVAKYADSSQEDQNARRPGLSIDASVAENIAIRLATVTRTPKSREIEVSGLIAFNERDAAIVQTRIAGFVEHVWPLAEGDVVKTGQPIADIMAPAWASAQQELLALRGLADSTLLEAARERLRLLGMPDGLIRKLEKSGVVQTHYTVSAPIAGVIRALEVRNGMTLQAGQTLARINGLSNPWLDLAVPESQADLAIIGNRAEIRLAGLSERTFEGKIAAILPSLNETSRSLRVRIELKNLRQQLRPGQSAQVRLSSGGQDTALTVPTETLIRTGKRTLVMLVDEQNRYSPTEVIAGNEIGNRTQIVSGLEEGQRVVASGQFLIDSEASLNGIEARSLPAAHRHGMEGAP
ncbi:MAG: efflux RND transporter periplasmic adaptor subunit [Methylomonas sp.]|jgi:Cu(I)/Ag(I) efflux system membrane fusion protein